MEEPFSDIRGSMSLLSSGAGDVKDGNYLGLICQAKQCENPVRHTHILCDICWNNELTRRAIELMYIEMDRMEKRIRREYVADFEKLALRIWADENKNKSLGEK